MSQSIRSALATAVAGAVFMMMAPAAQAVDADAALALARQNNCLKCHAVEKDKDGPSYKKVAAKYKGKADAEAKLTDFLTKSPKVKMDDGTEEEHKAVAAKDAAGLKNLIQYILAQ